MPVFERHDIVNLVADWRMLLAAPLDDEAVEVVAAWQAAARPFMVATRQPDDTAGSLRLGLAGPGKTRLSLVVTLPAIRDHRPPPRLEAVALACPPAWHPLLAALVALETRFGLPLRAYGSAAWQALTGLPYLAPASDLDLLIEPSTETDLPGALATLASMGGAVRLDGEIRFSGLGDIAWREWLAGPERMLLKTREGPRLIARERAA